MHAKTTSSVFARLATCGRLEGMRRSPDSLRRCSGAETGMTRPEEARGPPSTRPQTGLPRRRVGRPCRVAAKPAVGPTAAVLAAVGASQPGRSCKQPRSSGARLASLAGAAAPFWRRPHRERHPVAPRLQSSPRSSRLCARPQQPETMGRLALRRDRDDCIPGSLPCSARHRGSCRLARGSVGPGRRGRVDSKEHQQQVAARRCGSSRVGRQRSRSLRIRSTGVLPDGQRAGRSYRSTTKYAPPEAMK